MTLGASWAAQLISLCAMLGAGAACGGAFLLSYILTRKRSGWLERALTDLVSSVLGIIFFLLALQFTYDGALRAFHVIGFACGIYLAYPIYKIIKTKNLQPKNKLHRFKQTPP